MRRPPVRRTGAAIADARRLHGHPRCPRFVLAQESRRAICPDLRLPLARDRCRGGRPRRARRAPARTRAAGHQRPSGHHRPAQPPPGSRRRPRPRSPRRPPRRADRSPWSACPTRSGWRSPTTPTAARRRGRPRRAGRADPVARASTNPSLFVSSAGRAALAARLAGPEPVRRHLDHPHRRQARRPASPRPAPRSTRPRATRVGVAPPARVRGRDRVHHRPARSGPARLRAARTSSGCTRPIASTSSATRTARSPTATCSSCASRCAAPTTPCARTS